MALSATWDEDAFPQSVNGVTPCMRRGGHLYPPRIAPAPAPPGPIAFLRRVLSEPLRAIPKEAYEQPIGVRRWPVPVVYATAPDPVKSILVDQRDAFHRKPDAQRHILGRLLGQGILLAEGQTWRWQRQTTAPLFRHSEILGYLPTIVDAAGATVRKWQNAPSMPHAIDVDMTRATYDVIARTMLIGGSEEVTRIMESDATSYSRALPWAAVYGLLRAPHWLPRPGRSAMNRRDDALRAAVDAMISDHDDATGDDLLGRLLAARHPETGDAMTRAQLIDNILTFLLAGHHTTAMALTWTLYLLACAPEWAEHIHGEVERVVGDAPVSPAHIDDLVFVQQVLKESMRLLPPVPTMSTPGNCRYRTLRCSRQGPVRFTLIPIYVLHRHRSVWKNPDRFDPERFSPEQEKSHHPCQFMPFGRGPRTCSGLSFAMIEATVMLATFVRAARFTLPTPDYSPEPVSRVVLFPRDGLQLVVEPRD